MRTSAPISAAVFWFSKFLALSFGPFKGFHLANCVATAALIVAGRLLPGQSAPSMYFGNVTASNRGFERRLGAGNGVPRRWDKGLCFCAKACRQQIARRRAIMGTICQQPGDGTIDLVQQAPQSRAIADVIRGSIGADDLLADKVEAKVQIL